MFTKPLDANLKSKIYDSLCVDPEINIIPLRDQLEEFVDKENYDVIKEVMRIIKFMIKDRIPAKPKFYALLLIKELMETKKSQIVDYFIKKLMSRLFLIAQFDMRNPNLDRGERCLKKYYTQESKENSEYSLKFFILLLECWKHWMEMFSDRYKKIKEKGDKIRNIFPANDMYYDHVEKSASKLNKYNSNHVVFKSISDMPGDYQPNESIALRSRISIDSSEEFNPTRHNFSQANSSMNRVSLKGLENSNEIRKNLNEFIQRNNEDIFCEKYNYFYKAINDELSILGKNKASVMKSFNYEESYKMRYNDEIIALKRTIELFDTFGLCEISYDELKEQVASLEKKYPTGSQSLVNKTSSPFQKDKRNSRHAEDEDRIHDLHTVKSYSEDINMSNKKKNGSGLDARSPETAKQQSISQKSRIKNFQTTFGIVEESNEEDSHIGKQSNEPSSSKMIGESIDEKTGQWRTSIDQPDQSNPSGRISKNDSRTPKVPKSNSKEWGFNFENIERPEIHEDNAFGDFDGFERESGPITHRSEPNKTPIKQSSSSQRSGVNKKANSSSKNSNLEDNDPKKKSFKFEQDNFRNPPEMEKHTTPSPVYSDNLRMNTIIEESGEDIDYSKRSSYKGFNPALHRSMKPFSDNNRTVTDDGGENAQIIFEDFQDVIESSIGRKSDDSRIVRSEIGIGEKQDSRRHRADDVNLNMKSLTFSKNMDINSKDKFNQSLRTMKETSPTVKSDFKKTPKSHASEKHLQSRSENPLAMRNQKFDPAYIEAVNNERLRDDDFDDTTHNFNNTNKMSSHRLSETAKSKEQTAFSKNADVFKEPNFDFNFNTIRQSDRKKSPDHPSNAFDAFETGKQLFEFKDFPSNSTIVKDKRISNQQMNSSSVHGFVKNFDSTNEAQNFNGYDYEMRDSGLHEMNPEVNEFIAGEREPQNSFKPRGNVSERDWGLTYSDKKTDINGRQLSEIESSGRKYNPTDPSKFLKESQSRQQTLKSNENDFEFGQRQNLLKDSTPRNRLNQLSEESKDQFEDVIENESEHFRYNLQEQLKNLQVDSNEQNMGAKITATFGRTHQPVSAEKNIRSWQNSAHKNDMVQIGEALSKDMAFGKTEEHNEIDELDFDTMVQPNFDDQIANVISKFDNAYEKKSLKSSMPLSQNYPIEQNERPRFSTHDETTERIIKVRKQGNQQTARNSLSQNGLEVDGTLVDENQLREISELKVTNDFLRQQYNLLFNQLIERQKEVLSTETASTKVIPTSQKDIDLSEVEGKIAQRKNEFLSKENQMLKRVNDNLISHKHQKNRKKQEEIALYGQLNRELELYIAELQNELGKMIRNGASKKRLQ